MLHTQFSLPLCAAFSTDHIFNQPYSRVLTGLLSTTRIFNLLRFELTIPSTRHSFKHSFFQPARFSTYHALACYERVVEAG